MQLFLTNKIEYNISGIEKAQLYRWRIFNKLGILSKIVTFDFTPELDRFLYRNHVPKQASLNMFDYWQAIDFDSLLQNPKRNDIPEYSQTDTVEYYTERTIPEYHLNQNPINVIKKYDQNGQLIVREQWDIRGFISQRTFYQAGNWQKNVWYATNGQPVLIEENHHIYVTEHNRQYKQDASQNVFSSWTQLKAAWLDHLCDLYQDVVMFEDRADYTVPIVLNMASKVDIFRVLHSAHTVDRSDPLHSPLSDSLQYLVNNIDRYKGIIAATPEQKHDVQQRINLPVYVIPVAFAEKTTSQVRMIAQDKPANVVYMSRVSREKRIEDAIQIIARIPDSVNVSLNIYGFVSDGTYYNELLDLVKSLNTSHAINFRVFDPNVANILTDTDVFLLTSQYEGFNMSVLEAASFGVPFVSYDVLYGPHHLADTMQNGILVEPSNINESAQALTQLIMDHDLYGRLSNNALQQSEANFGMQAVADLWLKFFTDNHYEQFKQRKFLINHPDDGRLLKESLQAVAERNGYQTIDFVGDSISFAEQFNANDQVIVNYVTSAKEATESLVTVLRQRDVNVGILLRDSVVLQENADSFSEINMLNQADVIFTPNEIMNSGLRAAGVKVRLLAIGLNFVTLPAPQQATLDVNPFKVLVDDELLQTIEVDSINRIHGDDVRLYTYSQSTSNQIASNYLTYISNMTEAEMVQALQNFDGFGLIWSGGVYPYEQQAGRYMQFIYPVEAAVYIALEIPIIAWSGSALGHLINEHRIGITIDNLFDLHEAIKQLSLSEMYDMKNNLRRFKNTVSDAKYYDYIFNKMNANLN